MISQFQLTNSLEIFKRMKSVLPPTGPPYNKFRRVIRCITLTSSRVHSFCIRIILNEKIIITLTFALDYC